MFGVKPRLPVELELSSFTGASGTDEKWERDVIDAKVTDRLVELGTTVRADRELGLKNRKDAQIKQKSDYDLKHKGGFYKVGDKVLRKNCRKDTQRRQVDAPLGRIVRDC